MYNGGVFRGSWAYPLFAEDWRLDSNASRRRRQVAEPQALKNLEFFLAKVTDF